MNIKKLVDVLLKKTAMTVFVTIYTIALIALLSALCAVPAYYLWNWLLPEFFGIKTVTFWQAWGFYFLFTLLFKANPETIRKLTDS